jgi:hypothetical protein
MDESMRAVPSAELLARLHNRKDFLKEIFRPFYLLAENLIEIDDSFDIDTSGSYTPLHPGPTDEDDGAFFVMQAEQTVRGWEFQPR